MCSRVISVVTVKEGSLRHPKEVSQTANFGGIGRIPYGRTVTPNPDPANQCPARPQRGMNICGSLDDLAVAVENIAKTNQSTWS